MTPPVTPTPLELTFIRDIVEAALVECDQSDDISQGVVDGLAQVLAILGVKYERFDT